MLNTRHVLSTVFFKQALPFWQQPGSSLWLQSTGSSAGTAEGLTSYLIQGTALVSCHLKGHTLKPAVSAGSKPEENISDFQTVPSLVPKVYFFFALWVTWVDRELYLICFPETC